MKIFLLILAAVAVCFGAFAATEVREARDGVWTAELDGNSLHLSLFMGRDRSPEGLRYGGSQFGFGVPLAELGGLTATQAAANASDVQFTLTRAAGTIALDGRFSSGNGAGHYRFTPNPAFVREMESLGYKDAFDDTKLLLFTAEAFTPNMVRDLRAIGYDPTAHEGE